MRGVFWFFIVLFYTTHMENIVIRHAQVQDALWIARVQIDTWKSAYTGLIPQEHLDSLDIEKKIQKWNAKITSNEESVFVAEHNTEIIWFITWWDSHSKWEYDWEIIVFYVLERFQWYWIGTRLFQEMIQEFKILWYNSFYVWVLENWPGRRFYQKQGGMYIDKKIEKIRDIEISEVSYGWKNLSKI